MTSLSHHAVGSSSVLSPTALLSVEHLLSTLASLGPRAVSVAPSGSPRPLVWTDAMFTRAGARLAAWEEGCEASLGIVLHDPRADCFYTSQYDFPPEALPLLFGEKQQ